MTSDFGLSGDRIGKPAFAFLSVVARAGRRVLEGSWPGLFRKTTSCPIWKL